jgi:hypothetical protein
MTPHVDQPIVDGYKRLGSHATVHRVVVFAGNRRSVYLATPDERTRGDREIS